PALRQAEAAREAARAARIAAYQRALVDGPVLRLAFHHMKIEFDPRNVLALGDHGSVYPRLHVVDDWGTLDAAAGALLAADFAAVTVAAPASAGARTGPGWTLQLKPGWRLVAGPRAGDWQLARDEASTRTSP
ncbi:MAG TPA: hypothetical protein VFP84_34425, partial [Kofleriaceae bacterium]|nr:hypothetical protein [Kofleriaceae bacterium]